MDDELTKLRIYNLFQNNEAGATVTKTLKQSTEEYKRALEDYLNENLGRVDPEIRLQIDTVQTNLRILLELL